MSRIEPRTRKELNFSLLYNNNIIKKLNSIFFPGDVNESILNRYKANARVFFQKRLALALILSGFSLVFLLMMKVPVIIDLAMPSALFLTSYYLPVSFLKNKVYKQRVECEKVMPLLRLGLRFISKISSQEQDVLKLLIEMLRSVSLKTDTVNFQALYQKMIFGELPEHILRNFVSSSEKLDNLIHACGDMQNFSQLCNQMENFNEYKVYLKTLESRIVILIAEAIFFPLLFSMVYIFYMNLGPLHFVILVLHYAILKILVKTLLKKSFSLLYFADVFFWRNNEILDGFIEFLVELGKNLKCNSIEIAVMKTFRSGEKEFFNELGIQSKKFSLIANFSGFLHDISTRSKSEVIRMILSIIIELQRFAGEDYARLILDFAQEFKRQKELEEEKINIVNAERFKIKIICIFIPIILSIITALLSVMSCDGNCFDFSNSGSFMNGVPSETNIANIILFLILNSSYNYISCYFLVKTAGIQACHKYAIISALIFFVIFIFVVLSQQKTS